MHLIARLPSPATLAAASRSWSTSANGSGFAGAFAPVGRTSARSAGPGATASRAEAARPPAGTRPTDRRPDSRGGLRGSSCAGLRMAFSRPDVVAVGPVLVGRPVGHAVVEGELGDAPGRLPRGGGLHLGQARRPARRPSSGEIADLGHHAAAAVQDRRRSSAARPSSSR